MRNVIASPATRRLISHSVARSQTRSLVGSSLLALLGACLCGGYNGAGDRVYERGNESLILCTNGGFVANLASGPVEGTYVEPTAGVSGTATTGATGQIAFDYMIAGTGLLSAPQLGSGNWIRIDLDQTALDHADVQCTDLQMRSWWSSPGK
jgi:hypothetical protein